MDDEARMIRPPTPSRSLPIAAAWCAVAGALGLVAVCVGPPGWLLAWPALSFALVARGYARGDAGLFFKQADGTLPWLRLPHLWPYLGWMLAMTWLVRRVSGEATFHAVQPGLLLGGRPTARDLPAGATLLVDLTAELAAPLAPRVPGYACLPTLDGTAPALKPFAALVARVAAHDGPAYVHCAFGHGRSACVVVAVLVARAEAQHARDAFELVKRARPHARMSQSQWQLLDAWAALQKARS